MLRIPVTWFSWELARRVKGWKLPHYEQDGCIYFVTFVLADALPKPLWARLQRVRDDFLSRNPEPHTVEQEREFRRLYHLPLEHSLNRGEGCCCLSNKLVQNPLAHALLHGDDTRYALGRYVIMPNHVHLLVQLSAEEHLRDVCEQWKGVSAHKINKLLGRTGRLWQAEAFDHILRGPDRLRKSERYIARNPERLADGHYLLGAGKAHWGSDHQQHNPPRPSTVIAVRPKWPASPKRVLRTTRTGAR